MQVEAKMKLRLQLDENINLIQHEDQVSEETDTVTVKVTDCKHLI